MDRLGGGVRDELRRLGPAGAGDIAAIVAAWPEVAGSTVARNAWPLRLARDGRLSVATTSSTWAFELDRLAPMLLERLRERLGGAAPAGLRFAPGPVPAPAGPLDAEVAHSTPASAEERAEADLLASSIEDEELRSLVARAAAASLARGRSGRRF